MLQKEWDRELHENCGMVYWNGNAIRKWKCKENKPNYSDTKVGCVMEEKGMLSFVPYPYTIRRSMCYFMYTNPCVCVCIYVGECIVRNGPFYLIIEITTIWTVGSTSLRCSPTNWHWFFSFPFIRCWRKVNEWPELLVHSNQIG